MAHDPLALLNPAQRTAAEAVRGPVCILAGAGSGKTATITARIAHQVRSGVVAAHEVLAVTFTDRAARELRARLGGLGLDRPVRAATFHAAAWAQLRYFWPHLHPDRPLPDVLGSKLSLLIPLARGAGVEARDLANEIEWAKARRLTPETYAAGLGRRVPPLDPERMAAVYRHYEEAKQQRNVIDYEDMIGLATDMLEQDAGIAEQVRARYRTFTVDEFQDVNAAQYALLEAWLGGRDDVCVVGDDDQTIYSFTGASSRYLLEFPQRYTDATVVVLVENYRSTAPILALANSVLAPLRSGVGKELRAQTSDGPDPVLAACADDSDERARVVAGIQRLLAEGVRPGSIAVAYRVNSQSEPFEAALADAGLPSVVRGEEGFFARAEIRQALAALADAVREDARPAAADPADLPGTTPAAAPSADRRVEQVLRTRLSWHPRREPAAGVARERWRNLAALLDAASRAVRATPDLDLAALLAQFEQRAADGAETADPDGAIALLTLHKAKGLEFDAVFLVGCEEGLLPIRYAEDAEAIEEERRLLYVGITRARRYLHVSWATQRETRTGRMSRRSPSRFIAALATPSAHRKAAGRDRATRSRRQAGGDAGRTPPTQEAEHADNEVGARLRAWRRTRAAADGVPAYVIFPNRTLAELAARQPTTPAELAAVPGFGPARLERYGPAVLALITGQHP